MVAIQIENTDTNKIQSFNSIVKCCEYYKLSTTTMNKIILGKITLTRGILPDKIKITLGEKPQIPTFEPVDDLHCHCPTCNKTFKSSSKYTHVQSQKHKLLLDSNGG